MLPNLGWAQETFQTGPSCLLENKYMSYIYLKISVPAEGGEELFGLARISLEHFDGAIRGSSGQLLSIVIKLSIVLNNIIRAYILISSGHVQSRPRGRCRKSAEPMGRWWSTNDQQNGN